MDDINIFGPDEHAIINFKQYISAAFKMTDAGPVSYYLRMQVEAGLSRPIHITVLGAIHQALNQFGLTHIKTVATPLDVGHPLEAERHATATKEFRSEY